MASLQDQLLKAGVVKKGKAQQIRKEKQKQQKQRQQTGETTAADARALAEQARQKKRAEDQARNEALREQAEAKALQAQLKQLIATQKQSREGGMEAYQFAHHSKIKKLYVTKPQFEQLTRGELAVVALVADAYELVPAATAAKLQARSDQVVVAWNQPGPQAAAEDAGAADDPYADYQIPDDLMW